MPILIVVLHGPDAEQALAELRSNIDYDKLNVTVSVTEVDEKEVKNSCL